MAECVGSPAATGPFLGCLQASWRCGPCGNLAGVHVQAALILETPVLLKACNQRRPRVKALGSSKLVCARLLHSVVSEGLMRPTKRYSALK